MRGPEASGDRVPGDLEMEGAAGPRSAHDADGSSMEEHDVLDDREAQPGPPLFPRARLVDAIEALEDARLVRLRNAQAGVHHLAVDHPGAAVQPHTHGSAL